MFSLQNHINFYSISQLNFKFILIKLIFMQPNGDQACIDTLSALSANKCPTNAIYIFKYPMSHFSKNIISALLQTWFSIDCSLCASDFKIAQYRPLFTCSLFIFSMIKKQITLCCCGDLLPINFGLFDFFAKSVELHFCVQWNQSNWTNNPFFDFYETKSNFLSSLMFLQKPI